MTLALFLIQTGYIEPKNHLTALRHTEPLCQLPFALVLNRHELMTTQFNYRVEILFLFYAGPECLEDQRVSFSHSHNWTSIRRGRHPHVGQRRITRLHGIIDCQIMDGGRVAMVSHMAMTSPIPALHYCADPAPLSTFLAAQPLLNLSTEMHSPPYICSSGFGW